MIINSPSLNIWIRHESIWAYSYWWGTKIYSQNIDVFDINQIKRKTNADN